MTDQHRILIIAHGHPDFSPGGGEIAAYSLFKEFDKREDCKPVFLARHDRPTIGHGGTPFSTRTPNGREVLFYSRCDDYFLLSQPVKQLVWQHFREFLEGFKPTVVHFHHYLHLGIELVREVRKYSDTVPIVMTLHEYLAICYNSGQMIKTDGQRLCVKSSLADCHQCFPEKTPEDFFLRESYLKSFLRLIDVFISPSKFLIDRYVAWGLPKDRMVFIENGQPSNHIKNDESTDSQLHTRFAFFGQLSAFKGIEILFDAFALLPKKIKQSIRLDIYGSNLNFQPESFQKSFRDKLDKLDKQVRFHGAYRPEEIDQLLSTIGWVIIPSIWWENSPLVIQEAFKNMRPVICSDIGGMAEKVEDGVTGIHFRTRDPLDLADKITKLASDPQVWAEISSNIVAPPSITETADYHLKLYKKLIGNREHMCA